VNYQLDEQARRMLRAMRPLIEAELEPAIDEVIAGAARLPHVAELYRRHGDDIRRIELVQFRALLDADFDARYVEACRRTIEQETALGFEARARIYCGAAVLRRAIDAFARRHRFRPAAIAARTRILSQAILFDIATTSTYYLQWLDKVAEARRKAIDDAIADFNGVIGGVIAAIKETSDALTTASATVQRVSQDTQHRMAAAAAASVETAESMRITVAATEELAASIQEIGRQTVRGLEMARSSSGDAERTSGAIRSLEEASEHISSIVGLISKIAAQTNLLALNATIEAARAGDAGKEFAVVAAEVKALANQTSHATQDIAHQVAAIQAATKGAVSEISSIAHRISELAEIATNIAAAVNQQGTTTREIAARIGTTADNTARASVEIQSVEQAANHSAAAVSEITGWTARLSSRAQELEAKVANFFSRVRAA